MHLMTSMFRGIHDMAYVVTRAGGAAGAGTQQDWAGMSVNIAAGIGKLAWYAKDKINFLAEGLKTKGPIPTPTAIIDVAMVAVTVLDLLNGIWPPDNGSRFLLGKSEFENMQQYLEAATPDPAKWSGEAAEAYAAQCAILLKLSKDMQQYDKQLADLLSEHAARVQKMHKDYAIILMTLVAAQLTAMILWAWPVFGPVASVKFQVITVLAISFSLLGLQGEVCVASERKSHTIARLAEQYAAAGKAAEPVGSFATIKVPGAQEARVSSFEAISASMSGSMMSGPPPSFSTLAAMAKSDPSIEDPLLDAFGGAGEVPAAGASGTTETPTTPEAPQTSGPSNLTVPAFTPPTLSQISRASDQLARASGNASQQMNLVNQTMGQVQQIAQMGQGARSRRAGRRRGGGPGCGGPRRSQPRGRRRRRRGVRGHRRRRACPRRCRSRCHRTSPAARPDRTPGVNHRAGQDHSQPKQKRREMRR